MVENQLNSSIEGNEKSDQPLFDFGNCTSNNIRLLSNLIIATLIIYIINLIIDIILLNHISVFYFQRTIVVVLLNLITLYICKQQRLIIGSILFIISGYLMTYSLIIVNPSLFIKILPLYSLMTILFVAVIFKIRAILLTIIVNLINLYVTSEIMKDEIHNLNEIIIFLISATFLIIICSILINKWFLNIKVQNNQLYHNNSELFRNLCVLEDTAGKRKLFLAKMNHELRNLIHIQSAMIESLEENNSELIKNSEFQIIMKMNESLTNIMENYDNDAKITKLSLDAKLRKEDIEIRKFINELVDLHLFFSRKKQLEISFVINPQIPSIVQGYPQILHQILLNILNNSIKFTEKGKIQLNIDLISLNQSETILQFDVSDTGIGIENSKLDSVFEPYFQADPSISLKYGGMGLGLAITKQLVEMMGGNINIESEVGKGTNITFTIKFQSEISSSLSDISNNIPEYGVQPLRLLIADDSEDNREIMKHFLSQTNHLLDFAIDGEEALTKFVNNQYDVILIDLNMPNMDGFTTIKNMRLWEAENKLEHHTKIIVVSGSESIKNKDTNLFNGYLRKPFSKKQFIQIIQELELGQ
ncbi:MAG: ATP-binding response regulator [Candidatus Hodarchaeales archaeon]|jgi:signal transduction histidine kinase/CheY-like chemotaxis protein